MPQPYFSKTRNIELSVIKYTRQVIEASWDNVTVVKAFLDAYKEKKLPIVSVESGDVTHIRKEIGNTAFRGEPVINIDIFGTSIGFSNDMASFLVDSLSAGIPYYEFSDGSGETLDQTANGRVQVSTWIRDSKVSLGDSPHPHDKFRRALSFVVRKI